MAPSPNPAIWHMAYRLLYAAGGCCTAVCIALLAWVAFCIALEKEPLASIAFLPDLPPFIVLLLIILIMAIGVACWQIGARYHQRYEEYITKQR